MWNALAFRPSIPVTAPKSLEEMTKEKFDAKMARSLAQEEVGEGVPVDEL